MTSQQWRSDYKEVNCFNLLLIFETVRNNPWSPENILHKSEQHTALRAGSSNTARTEIGDFVGKTPSPIPLKNIVELPQAIYI